MRITPPPSPFLDAKDLQSRYATQIRKLSNQPWVADGDVSFTGVDTFTPPQELPKGMCADAVNKRFEDGRVWPRNGVIAEAWGAIASLNAPATAFTICGYARFNDPQGFDVQVVLTDEWRLAMGEDGGRGRCWRLQPGNLPLQVALNGQDVWGPARVIPCYNGCVILRQGNEQHYFQAASVGAAVITFNCAPQWVTGDLVQFMASVNSYFLPAAGGGGTVPNPTSQYYIKMTSATVGKLYTDAALTTALNFNGAVGSFWLMRNAASPGFYGNGAPALLAQPNTIGNTLWDVGFTQAPVAVYITNVASNVITAPNHNLLPGDAVAVTVITASGGGAVQSPAYVNPTSLNTLLLYDNAIDALAAGATGLLALTNNGAPAGATITKAGASGLSMPPGREGCFLENRLVIVNGNATLAISDPLDPLHFTPMTAAVTANLGESDVVTALVPLPLLDSLLILKQQEVLLLSNFSGGYSTWTLTTVTREYGCFAPLSAVQVGADVWFFSRKGVASITQTINGITQGVAVPVSKPMKKYIDLVDWRYAGGATAQYWNNRFYLALPLKGQAGTPVNNAWLVYNFLNQAWEGVWLGAALAAYAMQRLTVFGDERLCFLSPLGQVRWLGDGFADLATATGLVAISDSLTTRTYTCGSLARKLHLAMDATWDSYAPSITVTAVTPGVNEAEVLLPSPITYNRLNYAVAGLAPYVPGVTPFNAPYREDYQISAAELLAGAPDTHQNHTEGFRHRLDDWGIQYVIANATGSLRVQSVQVRAVGGPNLESAQV